LARVNTISPGTIYTPLAKDELTGLRGAGYRRMLELSPAGRGGKLIRRRTLCPSATGEPSGCDANIAKPRENDRLFGRLLHLPAKTF